MLLSEIEIPTVGSQLRSIGGVSPNRVLARPAPGTANARDLLRLVDGTYKCFVELVDHTLVAKVSDERCFGIACRLIFSVTNYCMKTRAGVVAGTRAPWRMKNGNIRLPDMSFMSCASFRRWKTRKPAIVPFAPDLAAHVIARGNTPTESKYRRRDYFASGTRLVWEIDPRRRVVTVYESAKIGKRLTGRDTLTGGEVMPGFKLKLSELFADPLA